MPIIIHIFTILFPIFAIVAVGYLYARSHSPDMQTTNQVNMDIFTPALVFGVLATKAVNVLFYYPLMIGCVIVILGSGLILVPIAYKLGFELRTFIPPMMFLNSANMGIPVAVFSFGERALPEAIVLFSVATILQFSLGTYIVGRHTRWWSFFKSPIILATFLGLFVNITALKIPALLLEPITTLGQVAIPLALLSLGAKLTQVDLTYWRMGLWGAVLRPLSGVTVFLLIYPWLTLTPLQSGLLLIFSALPPAVVNYIIAEQYQQEPHKVATIVMVGNALSFISMPIVLLFALPLAHTA